jgi:hypothetical protein
VRTPLYLGALVYKWCTDVSSSQVVLGMLTLPWLLQSRKEHTENGRLARLLFCRQPLPYRTGPMVSAGMMRFQR